MSCRWALGPPALGSALAYLEKARSPKETQGSLLWDEQPATCCQVTSHKRFTNAPQATLSF